MGQGLPSGSEGFEFFNKTEDTETDGSGKEFEEIVVDGLGLDQSLGAVRQLRPWNLPVVLQFAAVSANAPFWGGISR